MYKLVDVVHVQVPGIQLLLLAPEGLAISLPFPQPSANAPNCYLVFKVFCNKREPIRSDVIWSSSNPVFNVCRTFPLMLTPALLEKLCNKMCVLEVWHHVPACISVSTSPPSVSQDLVRQFRKIDLDEDGLLISLRRSVCVVSKKMVLVRSSCSLSLCQWLLSHMTPCSWWV